MARIARTDEEIDDVRARAADQIAEGGSGVPGMSYEEGVENALAWVLGDHDVDPMSE